VSRVGWAAGAAVLLVALGLGLWLGLRGGSSSSSGPQLGPTTTGAARSVAPLAPVTLSAAALKARTKTLDQNVYWVGPERGVQYELERKSDGNVFVRYLAANTRDPRTVGTYPLANAYEATTALAHRAGWAEGHTEGFLVVYSTATPATTVFVAAQGFPYQIEVYDPSPGKAHSLVESGAVGPVH
jgi:hypothetical protein